METERNLPVFDPQPLVDFTDGDADIMETCLETFRTNLGTQVQDVLTALEVGALAAAEKSAHTLKGACRTFGAAGLGEVAWFIEQHARQGNLPACREKAVELRPGMQDLLIRLEKVDWSSPDPFAAAI